MIARHARSLAVLATLGVVVACRFDPAYRDDAQAIATCDDGNLACNGTALVQCQGGKFGTLRDCAASGLVCAPTLLTCTPCVPNGVTCSGETVMLCDGTGQTQSPEATCDTTQGIACRSGSCVNLCQFASTTASNVGCEYWGADLDNAVTPQGNAAAQQYAIVVSNPQPDVPAHVTIQEDTATPGNPANIVTLATSTVPPNALEVFNLGPREVDGSPDGQFNTGTGTALTRHAFRVSADVPIVSYQFNPLDNVDVFSNDASEMLPTDALRSDSGRAYVIASWPQTIAMSDDPATNFGINLRAFLTIIGTQPNTHVHVKTTARIIPGGPLAEEVPAGASFDATLQPYEVLNLETGDFNADFTGSLIDADGPVAVYPGSEASDAPAYSTLAARQCCADHLEDQAVPVRAVGQSYVLGHVPSRTAVVAAAGGAILPIQEPEFYQIVAAFPGTTHVTTTLPAPDNAFDLTGEGAHALLSSLTDFMLTGSQPVIVADVQASQEAAGMPDGLPGGDPSLTYTPPIEQWRSDYTLLTPDKYAFDFLILTSATGGDVFIDGQKLDSTICEIGEGDGLSAAQRGAQHAPYTVYRCQLSFPVIDPTIAPPNNVLPGRQNDGVHRVQGSYPVGVLVYGFDSFVSYAYTGGTDLTTITVK